MLSKGKKGVKRIPYEHSVYKPGTEVYVKLAIRDRHPMSPLAGRLLKVTKGYIYPNLEKVEGDSTKLVPVSYKKKVWYVEPEFIV